VPAGFARDHKGCVALNNSLINNGRLAGWPAGLAADARGCLVGTDLVVDNGGQKGGQPD
jgi:hypothetical protein